MKIDSIIADLRALRGDPEVTSVDIDIAVALADEVERLRAALAGRTTPPTDEEIAAHASAGGSWIVGGLTVASRREALGAREVRAARARHAARDPGWPPYRWVAVDLYGNICAWPEVPRG